MKITLISDLHLECAPLELPGGDVLVLAGDVCEVTNYRKDSRSTKSKKTPTGHRYWDFFNTECAKYREVIYVFGNHEFYGSKLYKAHAEMTELLPDNITVLENSTHQIDDVLFVGATLWTDMNREDPLTLMHVKHMMNDYKYITMYNKVADAYHKLIPEHTVELHRKSLAYIKIVAEQNPDKKIVVVTHMPPTKQAIHDEYKNEYLMNGAFTSDLDEFIEQYPQIKHWCFGHTHHPFELEIGSTKLHCNPRGYTGYEQRAREFDPTYGFDV